MRLLAYTSPARGHLYPLVPILLTLVDGGDTCVIQTLSGELDHLAATGVEAMALDPVLECSQLEDWRARSPRLAIRSALQTFGRRALLEAPDLERTIAARDPDVLLVDINCWGAATVAEASGRPWVMYSPYLLPLPSRDAPPYGPGLAPLHGPLGTVRDALVRRVVTGGFDRAALGGVNAVRAVRGLPALQRFGGLLARAPLLLSFTAEGFEYPRSDWPGNIRLVGPINWSPPAPTPAWLPELPDPLVLVACSTERQADARLLQRALEALPAAGFSVIATSAAHDPDSFRAPLHSRVVRFISHEIVLERVVCVVCHGGMGITQKALAAGVPVVAVPFGRDQLETARRVEVARAGVRVPPRQLNGATLVQAVQDAIRRRPGALRVGRAYAAAGGATAAAAAIKGLFSDRINRRAHGNTPTARS